MFENFMKVVKKGLACEETCYGESMVRESGCSGFHSVKMKVKVQNSLHRLRVVQTHDLKK